MLSALILVLMVVLICLFFKGIYNIARAIALRVAFISKLSKICIDKKYKLTFTRNPAASFLGVSPAPDITLKTDDAEYVIRLITCRNRKRIWYFINDRMYVRVFRVFFSLRYSHRMDPFDISKKLGHISPLDKKYIKSNSTPVYIFNPSPVEINYITEDNEKKLAGNGSVIHGTTIYNGKGFLNMLGGRE